MAPSTIRIMMIEDDLDLCQGWKDIFDLLGYEAVFYQRGSDALKEKEKLSQAHLLISDFYLPDINGVDFIRKARAIHPTVPAILLTGSKEELVVSAARELPNCELLHKPLNIEDLERAVERAAAKVISPASIAI